MTELWKIVGTIKVSNVVDIDKCHINCTSVICICFIIEPVIQYKLFFFFKEFIIFFHLTCLCTIPNDIPTLHVTTFKNRPL